MFIVYIYNYSEYLQFIFTVTMNFQSLDFITDIVIIW